MPSNLISCVDNSQQDFGVSPSSMQGQYLLKIQLIASMWPERSNILDINRYVFFFISITIVIVFCLCSNSDQKSKSKSTNLDSSFSDSLKLEMICEDFMTALTKGKNLLAVSDCFQTIRTGINAKQIHFIETKFKVKKHVLKYTVFSKVKPEQPFFYDYLPGNYLSATINIGSKTFFLDSIAVEPFDCFSNRKMNVPLTLCNLLKCGSFDFSGQEYVVIQGYPPCNGRTCSESFLILINTNTWKLKVLVYNEYHPFAAQHIFFGDLNEDACLDYLLVNETMQNETYNVRMYSLKRMLDPFYPSKCSVSYSCEKCSGEISDTLVILKDDCGFF